jgi:hypothetical protein
MSMDELRVNCSMMKTLQNRKEELEAQLTGVNKELDLIRTKKIPELMESMELRNVTIEGLGRVQLAADIYASTREGQKETAMTWLRDCGYDNMITETYNGVSGLERSRPRWWLLRFVQQPEGSGRPQSSGSR